MTRSLLTELRTALVISPVALTLRNFLCLYLENAGLLLRSLDKYVGETYCSSLDILINSLVFSANNRACTFSCCSVCEDFFSEKIEKKVKDIGTKIA